MNWRNRLQQLIPAALVFTLVGCAPGANHITDTPISPTEEFTGKNDFGDGYIAHIPIDEVKQENQEEIVTILVTQWLQHYKTESTQPDVMIKDYKIDKVTVTVRDIQTHMDNPALPVKAGVQFSILPPEEIPNEWRCAPISTENPWCHLTLAFGVYGNEKTGQYYWLKIINYGG